MSWLSKLNSRIFWFKEERRCYVEGPVRDAPHLVHVRFLDSPDKVVQVYRSQIYSKPNDKTIRKMTQEVSQEPDVMCEYCGKLGKHPSACEHCDKDRD